MENNVVECVRKIVITNMRVKSMLSCRHGLFPPAENVLLF